MIDEKKLLAEIEEGKWSFKIQVPSEYAEVAEYVAKKSNEIIRDAIHRQPKVDTWFLCIERLPDEPRNIAQSSTSHHEVIKYNTLIMGEPCIKELYYCGNGSWQDDMFKEYKGYVFAWQPLPEV